MTNRCIAGNCFHLVHRSGGRASGQRPFDAAMLQPVRNLQVKNLFAVALESEVSRLYDAGVYRTDRDLMYFITFNTVKIHHTGQQTATVAVVPESHPLAERLLKANRLEPGVPFRADQTLFGDLPFKQVQLRTGCRQ